MSFEAIGWTVYCLVVAVEDLNTVLQVKGARCAPQVEFLERVPEKCYPAVFWHIKTRSLSDLRGFEFLDLFELGCMSVCSQITWDGCHGDHLPVSLHMYHHFHYSSLWQLHPLHLSTIISVVLVESIRSRCHFSLVEVYDRQAGSVSKFNSLAYWH